MKTWIKSNNIDMLLEWFSSIENVEHKFNIEYSCGDGKYLSDLSLQEELQYDGKVCENFIFRNKDSKKEYKEPRWLIFDYNSKKTMGRYCDGMSNFKIGRKESAGD